MTKELTKAEIFELLEAEFLHTNVRRNELLDFFKAKGIKFPRWLLSSKRRVERGVYNISRVLKKEPAQAPAPVITEQQTQAIVNAVAAEQEFENLIPNKNPLYVRWGHHSILKRIIKSGEFVPAFITGLSGCGKTLMVEQVCAELGREFYRVNVTNETDEDDLLGGFRLVNDCTKWFDGPVIRAMKAGGVLLLDEVDLSVGNIMCLQPILEGKGVLLKKINKFIEPAPGFTVIATANTKGKGDESGQFMFTNILNEAFLERFPITMEQPYATEAVEKKILNKVLADSDQEDFERTELIDHLVTWAQATRKTFEDGGAEEIISTRRLVQIANVFMILKDKKKAVNYCIARFDAITIGSFGQLFKQYDPEEKRKAEEEARRLEEEKQQTIKEMDDDIMKIINP